jgi:predicted ribosomally synthesized peptide with SipW-like signal peptide
MKSRVILSGFILVLAIAMIAGATLAWFTDSDSAGEAVFTAGTVDIEAGRKVVLDDDDCDCIQEVVLFPARVVKYEFGHAGYSTELGLSVKDERKNPKAVLKLETGRNEKNFCSLGFGGHIIVEFEYPIYASQLLVVCEDTWGSNYPLETADIFVSKSSDGPWVRVGEADNSGTGDQTYTQLPVVDLEYVKYVKVVVIPHIKPDYFERV